MNPCAVSCGCAGMALLFGGVTHAQQTKVPPTPALANTPYIVTSTSDAGNDNRNPTVCDDGTGHCTLRGAIQIANNQSGADVINIALAPGAVINLGSALPDIVQPLTINGPAAGKVTVRRNSATNFSVFTVTGGPVTFSGLTISNGGAQDGGGINNVFRTVNVTNCVFLGNVAINGGGIYNKGGTLNVTNCTFTGNGASGDGGGISNDFFGTANVSNSTFSGNSANNGDPTVSGGGAICNRDHNRSQGGAMTVTNSTIVGNTAARGGGLSFGGAAAGGFLTVTHSTIVGNSSFFSDSAGGISSDSQGPVNIKNTIVVLNAGATGRCFRHLRFERLQFDREKRWQHRLHRCDGSNWDHRGPARLTLSSLRPVSIRPASALSEPRTQMRPGRGSSQMQRRPA